MLRNSDMRLKGHSRSLKVVSFSRFDIHNFLTVFSINFGRTYRAHVPFTKAHLVPLSEVFLVTSEDFDNILK